VEDVVVPGGAISQLVSRARELEAETGLEVAIFGHAGDGNFHINPMKPEALSPEEWDRALTKFLEGLYRTTVDLGGTISGEHGIGRKRVASIPIALSAVEIATMRALKDALDPRGLLNPGVLLP
jgi:glycolate oxidase